MNARKLFTAILFGGLLLLVNGGMTPVQALLAAHDCSFCHDFHGAISNAGLLKYANSEAVCLSCHNVSINDTTAAAIHNPLSKVSTDSGYITCRECHNPHDNVGGNIKLIGYKYDPATGQRFVNPTIWVETTVSPPPYPTYKTVTFTSSADFNKGNGAGSCEICHSGNHHVGEDCMGCHGHADGFVASCAGCHDSPPATGAHLKHAGTGAGQYAYDCALCHPGDHDGTAADITFTGLAATWAGATYSAAQKQCSNLYCHGSATADWDAGTGGTCGDCHGAAGSGRPDGVNEPPGGNHLTTSHQVACVNCHTHDGTNTTEHVNGPANANGDALVSAAGTSVDSYSYAGSSHASSPDPDGYKYTGGTCSSVTCHGSVSPVWGGGALACTVCHDGSGAGALKVGSSSPHVICGTKAGMNAFNACSDCHPKHTGGVLVANNATVGISYTTGGRTGFRLGGTATTGSTEAEICWNCHSDTTTYQTTAISEWGSNNKQSGAPAALAAYNYGTVLTPNWTTATWTSAQALFGYKTAAIQLTHSVNSAGTSTVTATSGYYAETKDNVADIRCSYCHDVHDTASGVVAGDVIGKPFLRGTWWTNPYKEDGAPGGAYNAYSTTPVYGAVPRGYSATPSVNATAYGGWQIDQNNNYPTVSTGYTGANWTVDNSAGLCKLCHSGSVDGMNWNTAEGNLWVGTNGHSNAVIGGTGANLFNVYNPNTRNEGTTATNPKMAYQLNNTARQYGLRNNNGNNNVTSNGTTYIGTTADGVGVYPYAGVGATAQVRYAYQTSTGAGNTGVWGVDQSTTTAQTQYHKFSCSKCHNPHASRLPKLMITNCLDVSHNSWDNSFSNDGDWTGGNQVWLTVGVFPTGTETAGHNKEFAYAKSAQNCHRYIDNNGDGTITTGDTGGDEPGWNKVTPWK